MRHIRKTLSWREVVHADAQGRPCTPVSRAVAMAVLTNPLSGKDSEDLSILFDLGGEVGELLAGEALALLGKDAVSYGKAAIVGTAGDMEHGAATIHPKHREGDADADRWRQGADPVQRQGRGGRNVHRRPARAQG